MALTNEQIAELKSILGPVVVDQVKETMGKPVEEQVKDALSKIIDRKELPVESKKSVGQFKNMGEMLWSIKKNPNDPRLKALAEGTDSTGGFLVPEEFKATLLQLALERSVVRPFATKIPMTSDTLMIPKIQETSHASHLKGGVIAYWLEEAGTKTPTDPVFSQVKLIAHKLTGYTYASDELLADSAISLESLLRQTFGGAIGWYEDLAFLRGNGTGQPLGIFQSGALVRPTRAVASQVALADLAKIMARMYPDSLYQPTTLWIFSPAVLAQLIQLVATVITWLPASGGIAGRIPGTILGMPFMITEKVPTLGTSGDIGLYDLSYYLIGDRSDLRIDSSTHVRFTTDETAWRFVERVDGQPWVDSAFTPYNAGDTLSPFVQLSSATA
jgi:HK97 family phage major capsid protein